jgi:SAM-dependent methyltransferase
MLKRPLPPDRNYEQVLKHYLVEKAIADRLKRSTPQQRKLIFESMYDELFEKVPDHPRLVRSHDHALTALASKQKLAVVSRFLKPTDRYLEFGPGDCRFAMHIANRVQQAYGVDISDQRNTDDEAPENFELIVYDGYTLDKPAPGTIDIIFSDQLIEHFHPDDTRRHFKLARKLLRPGGLYVFRTPHAYTGPHDVSMYFCDEAEGFHLKEWTYAELGQLLSDLKFASVHCYRFAKGRGVRIPFSTALSLEKLLAAMPPRYARLATNALFSCICGVAVK